MENETIILALRIIASLCFWGFILTFLFKGIKYLYLRFIKKQPVDISFDKPMSDEEKMKIAQEIGENKHKNSIFQTIYNVLLLIIATPFLLIGKLIKGVIYVFIKRCPKCKAEQIEELGSKEIDRWLDYKKVDERLASGKTKTRHVQVTKVKIRYDYRCKNCGHHFSETATREK